MGGLVKPGGQDRARGRRGASDRGRIASWDSGTRGAGAPQPATRRRGAGAALAAPRSTLLAITIASLVATATAVAEKPIEKPLNTSPPTISGKAQEGITLKAKEGKWSGGSIAYSFQWQRCEPELECTNIPLATTSEYTARYVDIGSALRVLITASNSAGSTEVFTERTAAVVGVAPKNIELPVISGAAQEGQLLSVSSGAWSGTVASRYLYAWERCAGKKCSEIAGANASSYRVAAADVGDTLRASVTDQNLAGSKSATSLPDGDRDVRATRADRLSRDQRAGCAKGARSKRTPAAGSGPGRSNTATRGKRATPKEAARTRPAPPTCWEPAPPATR